MSIVKMHCLRLATTGLLLLLNACSLIPDAPGPIGIPGL